ncbi:S-adenosyl-L-methionine-dependent methyltransferase [Coniochaeta sp. 2T2.1]|nr:S-adenosyl-L-methionine-dependent methyltransferase [Coniochaeta sp. 2T2.1]
MSHPTPPPTGLPLSLAPQIASYAIQPPRGPTPASQAIELSQARHRINLLNAWSSIFPGSRVLELGCGQGTCTAVLAEAVGPSGHVDAVDPASLDYGSPFTLGEAQACLSQGPVGVGGRITFHQRDPVEFLKENEGKWDVAVLAHCIWYFRSAKEVGDVLAALRGRVDRVLIAEYALHASEREAVPHVLATVARAALEAHRKDSDENIQTVLSPVGIRELAEGAGWKVVREETVVPEPELSDGGWETGSVVSKGYLEDVEKGVEDERVKAMLRSARDAVVAAVDGIGGVGKVRTMDVWVATLEAQ